MKKPAFYLGILFAVILLSKSAFSQNPIPSYDVPVVADPTSFEEAPPPNRTPILKAMGTNPFSQKPINRTEKLLKIKTKDKVTNNTAWSEFIIYSIDSNIEYGPYTNMEGTIFEKTLSSQYEWGVRVNDASSECEMDVWFD